VPPWLVLLLVWLGGLGCGIWLGAIIAINRGVWRSKWDNREGHPHF
jgi:hypothetical protein